MAPLVYAFTVDHNGEGLLPLELRAPRVLLGLALLTRRWRCGGGAAKGGASAGSRARSLHFRCGASWSPPFSRNEKIRTSRARQVMHPNVEVGTPGLGMLTHLSMACAAQVTVRASRVTSRCCRRRTPVRPQEYGNSHGSGWPRRGGGAFAAGEDPPTTAPSGGSPSSPASSRAEVRPSRTPALPFSTCASQLPCALDPLAA